MAASDFYLIRSHLSDVKRVYKKKLEELKNSPVSKDAIVNAEDIGSDEPLPKKFELYKAKLDEFERGYKFLQGLAEAPVTAALAPKDIVKAAIAGWGWRQTVRASLSRYDEIRDFRRLHEATYLQVKNKSGSVLVRSNFSLSINRRYQPRHMWPTYVGKWSDFELLLARLERQQFKLASNARIHPRLAPLGGVSMDDNCVQEGPPKSSYRKRWFSAPHPESGRPCPLVGYDISSSQTQIVAVFLGIEALEKLTMDLGQDPMPFKKTLATWAFEMHDDEGGAFRLRTVREGLKKTVKPYSGPEDTRLQELCKSLWMKISYGSSISVVVTEQDSDPDTFGPGWKWNNAQLFLDFINKQFPQMQEFLAACAYIGKKAVEEDPCEGAVFIDPSDGSEVRWNPVARKDQPLKSDGHTLMLSLPASEKINNTFKIGADVRYPVDKVALKKMIAPCLIHMLDAFYSTLVMDKLAKHKIANFVGIHDCWLVPETVVVDGEPCDGRGELEKVMQEAAREWYQGLAPVYGRLRYYLKGHNKFEPLIDAAETLWKKRISEGYTPPFLSKLD